MRLAPRRRETEPGPLACAGVQAAQRSFAEGGGDKGHMWLSPASLPRPAAHPRKTLTPERHKGSQLCLSRCFCTDGSLEEMDAPQAAGPPSVPPPRTSQSLSSPPHCPPGARRDQEATFASLQIPGGRVPKPAWLTALGDTGRSEPGPRPSPRPLSRPGQAWGPARGSASKRAPQAQCLSVKTPSSFSGNVFFLQW